MTVAECLAVARAAHQEYRENVARRVSEGAKGSNTTPTNGDPAIAQSALRRAYDALSEAERLDLEMTDPAWRGHTHVAQHYELLVFYRQQLEGK